MVTLLFTKKKTLASKLIRLFTWSRWSHVALLCKDGTVIESAGFYGVRKVPLHEALEGVTEFATVTCFDYIDEAKLIECLLPQIGKPYDYIGALGLGIHRNWQDDDKWICSELIAWGFDKIGEPLFRSEEISKITQQDLWKLNSKDHKTSIISLR